jgi:putative ABC transport system substrate-binding protein
MTHPLVSAAAVRRHDWRSAWWIARLCLWTLAAVVFLLVGGGLTGNSAVGQSRATPVLIGALTESWGPTVEVVGLRDGLQELGYRENEHFVIGVRFTQGNPAALPEAARELVQYGADIILAAGTRAARAAQLATSRVPIVFVGGSDPVGLGLVQSFARPGGNVTGVANLDTELAPKRLEIFRELVPGLKRVLLPYDATDAHAVSLLGVYRTAASHLGITLIERPARTEAEARAAIVEIRRGEVHGILSPRFLSLNIPGFMLAVTRSVPTMFHGPFYVERGGLASYSASEHQTARQAARLVDKILKGANPADLPVEQPTKFELLINLTTAKTLGLTIPQSLLLRADGLIQ